LFFIFQSVSKFAQNKYIRRQEGKRGSKRARGDGTGKRGSKRARGDGTGKRGRFSFEQGFCCF